MEVRAIAAEYAPRLAELECQRDVLMASEYYLPNSGSRGPNSEWAIKQRATVHGVFDAEKAIRDVER